MAKEMYTPYEVGYHRIQWGAVIAGVLLALVIQGLLTLFGLAIGLTALDPTQGDFTGLGVGSGLWLILSTLISVFIGSWLASWLSNTLNRPDAIIHGVLTWSVFLLVTLFLIGSGVGNLVGGAFNLLSSAVSGTGESVVSQMIGRGDTPQSIQERLTGMLPEGAQPAERLTAQRTEQITNVASRVAWWAFIAAMLSLVVSILGGAAGSRGGGARIPREPV